MVWLSRDMPRPTKHNNTFAEQQSHNIFKGKPKKHTESLTNQYLANSMQLPKAVFQA